jgi:hypothetical protein
MLLAKYEEHGELQLKQERTRITFRKAATVLDVGGDAMIERMASEQDKLEASEIDHHPCIHACGDCTPLLAP